MSESYCACGICRADCDYHRKPDPGLFGISRANPALAAISDKELLSMQKEINDILKQMMEASAVCNKFWLPDAEWLDK